MPVTLRHHHRARTPRRSRFRPSERLGRPGALVAAALDLRVQQVEEAQPTAQVRPALRVPATEYPEVKVATDAWPSAASGPTRRYPKVKAQPAKDPCRLAQLSVREIALRSDVCVLDSDTARIVR